MPDLNRKDALLLSLLLLLVLLFFRPFIFNGLIPLNADWLHSNFQPGASYFPGVRPHNLELDDPIYQFYPLRMEAVRQWKSGSIPLWNPWIFCGNPLLADGISKPFDPLIFLWLVFGGPVGHSLELIFQFSLMLTGMYILARALGIPPLGAALSSIVYTFNLLSVTWMELRTAGGAFAFFPWAFLFLLASLNTSRFGYAALAGILAGFMALAGHPQFVCYGFFLLSLFVLWKTLSLWRLRGPRPALLAFSCGALALLLALALSAVETIPLLELARHSARNPRQYEIANLSSTPLSFLTYIYPNFFGNPSAGGYIGGILMRPYMTAAAGFVGVSTLLFALAGLFLSAFPHKRFFALLLFLTPLTLIATSAGLGQALSLVTHFFSAMDVARLVFISNFAVSLLAGAGAASLARADWSSPPFKHLSLVSIASILLILILTASLREIRRPLSLFDRDQSHSLLLFLNLVERRVASPLFWPPVCASLRYAAAALAIILLSPFLKKLSSLAAVSLVAFELLLAGVSYNPFVPPSLISPPFAPLSSVDAPPGRWRILGLDPPAPSELVSIKGDWLVPNTSILYNLEDVRGDESLRLLRYQRYILRIVGQFVDIQASIHMPFFDSPLLDALNVKYLFSSTRLRRPGLIPLFSDGKSFVYENSRALPRAWLVGQWLPAPSETTSLIAITADRDFDFRTCVVVEPGASTLLLPPAVFSPGSVSITEYLPSRIRLSSSCSTLSMLVLADSWYPGWRAFVDGVETHVMPANAVFRAVFLPPGDHSIEFIYFPHSFKAGAFLSLSSLLLSLALVVSSFLLRRPSLDKPPSGL